MSRPTVHLVDGTFELFRCFHGAPRASVDGREVGALRGLLATLRKLLRTADHAAVVFDPMAPPRRGDRSADALLRSQARGALDVVRALGLPCWVTPRGQADDLLASAAAAYRDRARVVVCTTDKDLLQCVRGRDVVVWDRIRDRVTDEDALRERFGVGPEQVPDLQALVGDPSDGLPGVPGWGLRSAAAVLAVHRRLEDVPDDAERWEVRPRGAARLAASLRAHRADALVVRDVATLRTDLPVRVPVEALAWRGAPAEAADVLSALE
ncbi:MAG: 5'-3' exonuclease H3TH domain-containing protein [Myxococcota bacterium]